MTKQSTVDHQASTELIQMSATFDFARDDNSRVDELVCVTTGIKASETVRVFCLEKGYGYLHLRVPNKLWTLLCLCGLASLSKSAERRIGPIDLILLPNLGFTGQLHRPYTLLLHDCSFRLEPRWFKWKRRLWHALLPIRTLIEKASRIDCVSEQTRQDALRFFALDVDRVSVILPMTQGLPSGEELRPPWLPASIQRYALLLGGADRRKNIHIALRAISTFNIQHSTTTIVPVVLGGKVNCRPGHCPLSFLKAPDAVSDEEIRYLYGHAAVLLYPSWYEGFGLPLHEAYQLNIPIIASSTGALPETAPPGTIFCHPAKPQEWVIALETLLKQ